MVQNKRLYEAHVLYPSIVIFELEASQSQNVKCHCPEATHFVGYCDSFKKS